MELLVATTTGAVLLAGFSTFYVGQQRALRRNQVEVESSQELRIALEQISRDLRSAGRNPLGKATIENITSASSTEVDLSIDSDNNGVITSTSMDETKGFRRSGTSIQTYRPDQADTWPTLASYIDSSQSIFRYYDCSGTEVTTLDATGRASIARVDITVKTSRTGGIALNRRETTSVRLRNKSC